MSEQPTYDGNYTVRLARNFIYKSYQEAGIQFDLNQMMRSSLEDELGKLPDGWNAGLFRYLDECIALLNNAEFTLTFAVAQRRDSSLGALITLIHQIKCNVIAIRVLGNHGLDDQCRLTLRALYENCIALCRAVVDVEFRAAFSAATSTAKANSFWHTYIARSKSETYLSSYNKMAKRKCPFVIGGWFENARLILGVSAHPNFLGSSIAWKNRWADSETLDSIASAHHAASEFVLANTCQMALCAASFLGYFGDELGGDAPTFLAENPNCLLSQAKTAKAALDKNGRAASLMFLMLAKWINRQRKNFDPEKHF